MIDEIDQKLIELLMSDSRQSSRVLADKLGIDGSTVRRRVKKLAENGVMIYSVLPNPDVLGFPVRAIIALNVDPKKIKEIIKILTNQKEIKWVSPTTGRYDIILFAWFNSNEAIYDFIEGTVGNIEGVRNAETFICLSNDFDFMPH
jgi:Lrp/AsnC family transcriptional regulator, regulator for asnA, asnC and gidA